MKAVKQVTWKEELTARTQKIETLIREYLPKETGLQKTIFEASNYSICAGGKRLRPMLMGETYRLFGGQGKEIRPFMAAIEMIHTSSLVHDDLPCMDNDQYRRGKKTTWVAFGYDMAVLAGDALLTYAFETAAKAFADTEYPERVGRAMGILAHKTGIYGMIGGQTVDVEYAGKTLSEERLDFIYRLKTSALLEASMLIGAVLAGATRNEQRLIEQAASELGLAFQIQDDILDVTGTQETLGKPVGSDEKNQKTTYVTLKGIDRARQDVADLSRRAVERLEGLVVKNEFLVRLMLYLIQREK